MIPMKNTKKASHASGPVTNSYMGDSFDNAIG
jgi:hypothetical protein